jgi:hypothetical protein
MQVVEVLVLTPTQQHVQPHPVVLAAAVPAAFVVESMQVVTQPMASVVVAVVVPFLAAAVQTADAVAQAS